MRIIVWMICCLCHIHSEFLPKNVKKNGLKKHWMDLRLVDSCVTAKDLLFHAKQDVLVETRCWESLWVLVLEKESTEDDTEGQKKYPVFKRKLTMLALNKNQALIAVISLLKEAESVTLDLIEASSIAGIKGHSRRSGWFFVSELEHSRNSPGQDHKETPELEEFDVALCKLAAYRTSKCDTGMQIDDLHYQLTDMNSSIQVVEEKLECLFKRLIKTRGFVTQHAKPLADE
ncbi:UNVERIFIED_CONTAM: hypothetical protein Slati_3320000 [Sesamum latifolium]|uniref:Uncharacterized protein n=1 Tax=Sesamum latifolium TaxID=2727402 RepID=A0AAW2V3R8_9LAMI